MLIAVSANFDYSSCSDGSWLLDRMLTFLVCAGYAVYFDHKRRSDPEFRKALKRESRREARAAKEQAEAQGQEQKQAIKTAVDEAKEEGFPTDVEDKEAYFMNEVGQGEVLCQDSKLSIGSHSFVQAKDFIRFEASRGCALLLQGPQGLSPTKRPHPDIRQNCTEASHRYSSRNDRTGPYDFCRPVRPG